MAENKSDDLLGKGLGLIVATGALALGVAAALMNNERSRQMREEFRGRIDDLGRRVDDLSAEARHRIDERRPEIEQGIQRGRQAAVEGLEKVKSAMEQGAEKAKVWVDQGAERAQDMVQRAVQKSGGATQSADDGALALESGVGDKVADVAGEAEAAASEIHDGAHGDAGPGDGSGAQDTVFLGGDSREEAPSGY